MYKYIFLLLTSIVSILPASEFSISSYNCGGLSDHYDYLRAASMQKIMQERYMAEPENMSLNENIQKLALKILFSTDNQERSHAQQEWDQKKYQTLFEKITAAPTESDSPNKVWHEKVNGSITSYKIRPVTIFDEEVNQMLWDHYKDLSGKEGFDQVTEVRARMAKRIFAQHLKFDIICLQEADYLDRSMFPEHYEVLFSESSHSINGMAWNKQRFELIKTIGNILDRAFAVHLLDKETGKTVLIASGHITGCNPYKVDANDSAKGDNELTTLVELFDNHIADFKIVGMDSNVTSLHPRLNIIKEAGYQLDYENFLDPTCANPHQVLNTRIDWITVKSALPNKITNIPVLGVGLNQLQTNMSDHKPIAAKVTY